MSKIGQEFLALTSDDMGEPLAYDPADLREDMTLEGDDGSDD